MVPVAIFIFIFSDQIINLVFGKEYLPSSNTLRIVTVAVVISQLTFWISPALLAFGRPGLRTLMGLGSTVSYIVLLFLLVPKFSHIGAAFAFLGYAIVRPSISILSLRASMNEKKKLIEINVPPTIDRKA